MKTGALRRLREIRQRPKAPELAKVESVEFFCGGVFVEPVGPTLPHRNSICARSLGELVPDGWLPGRWVERLEELADKCDSVNPDKAAEHRKTAAEIRAKLGDTT